jgi:tetratricopeptide (TPR) repeat protein
MKDPGRRPQSADEVVEALDAVVIRQSTMAGMPTALLVPVVLGKALILYLASVLAVLLVTRAAIAWIGLPDWVLAGAMITMALGLPPVLLTSVVHYMTRRAASEAPGAQEAGVRAPRFLARFVERTSRHVSWRRTTQGGVLALGAFALFVAGFMTMRALGVGPAASLLASGKLDERNFVVIADFNVDEGDSSLARISAEAVRTGLGESPMFRIMPPARIAGALQRMQAAPTSPIDAARAKEIAIRENAKAIVTGDITRLGDGYVVTLRLVSADSGAELASFHETADAPHDLLPTIDKLTRRLRGKAGESLRKVHADPPLEQVTTPSLEALRFYAEGARANVAGDFTGAVAPLKQAIALDSSFAMAWRLLGVVYANGSFPAEKSDSALDRAYRFRDRLTDRERQHAIGSYYIAGPGRDRAKAVAAWEAILSRYPDDVTALTSIGTASESRRDWTRAESAARRALSLEPKGNTFPFRILINSLIGAKRLDDAQVVLEKFAAAYPNAPQLWGRSVSIQYARGALDSVEVLLNEFRKIENVQRRARADELLAALLLLRGRLRESDAAFARARAENALRGAPRHPFENTVLASYVDIWIRERPAQALLRVDSAVARTALRTLPLGERGYFTIASLYALTGHPEKARPILAQYDAAVLDTSWIRSDQPHKHATLGEIALADARYADAAREFRLADSLPDGPSDICIRCVYGHLARVFDKAGMRDSAILMFERYLSTYELNPLEVTQDPLFLAGTYFRLGELYENKADRARAVDYYCRFVSLWKNADPELQPRVTEVKQRLSRLGYRT